MHFLKILPVLNNAEMAQRWARNGVTSVFVLFFSTDELIHGFLHPGGRGGIRPDIRGGKEGEERQRREGEDKRLTKEKR